MHETGEKIDSLIRHAVFDEDSEARAKSRRYIRELALAVGVFPASIHGIYMAASKGPEKPFTVPAINIRGLTYDVARSVFSAALKDRVGALIFEIARSEIGYTGQRPDEYAVCILAAAVREGFKGPVFIQGDHFQVNASRYREDPEKETGAMKDLIREAVDAGFFNIDIDASTIVDLSRPDLEQQQEMNCRVTADMTRFIRAIEPGGVTISIGGEIGEVGKRNSTVEDLRAFMNGYLRMLEPGLEGISKISVQTGTSHGGVVLPDGSMAEVKIDFDTIRALTRVARDEYRLGGVVQHGASTLPDEAFDRFPEAGTLEIHLATAFQNLIYDSPDFPKDLRDRIYRHISEKFAGERKAGDSQEQFIYKTRKKGFGGFKREMWGLPEENREAIRDTLESRFSLLFHKLNVVDTRFHQEPPPRFAPTR
ncbi:MAG: class II fructose-bisphosphate aldolase [Dehalococcoidia bacterium]|nr:class II fructose-bisphosphate aldolase [Dehalococcoidia bacterium]